MKFNKWTLGLAAVGVVSLTSAARADEKVSQLQTALSNTTISGYVSASANWSLTPAYNVGSPASGAASGIPFQGAAYSKENGINLDVVRLTIAKPEDETPWASGYDIDLAFGPDAVGYNTSVNAGTTPDYAIKQAYVTLRTPVGNGIDWKIGVFDTIIGYEVTDAGSNPNYTRSYGYAVEPTEHTGVLATYAVNSEWTFSAGVADTLTAGINNRATSPTGGPASAPDEKTLLASVTYTAPKSWGWAAGSAFYVGAVYGYGGGNPAAAADAGDQFNGYLGATVNTPWSKLTTGVAIDYVHNLAGGVGPTGPLGATGPFGIPIPPFSGATVEFNPLVAGLYATYKATDKLSLNARGEWVYVQAETTSGSPTSNFYDDIVELTGTVEYDMWANVMTRVELRYDHNMSGGDSPSYQASSVGLYANVIYKF